MQSKGAKIGYIVLLLVIGAGVFWMRNNGPMADQARANREFYKNYVKAEGVITETTHNGRIGKGSAIIYTVEFLDKNGTKRNGTYRQDTFLSKDKGDKITIYYNAENPSSITSEDSYNEIMN